MFCFRNVVTDNGPFLWLTDISCRCDRRRLNCCFAIQLILLEIKTGIVIFLRIEPDNFDYLYKITRSFGVKFVDRWRNRNSRKPSLTVCLSVYVCVESVCVSQTCEFSNRFHGNQHFNVTFFFQPNCVHLHDECCRTKYDVINESIHCDNIWFN